MFLTKEKAPVCQSRLASNYVKFTSLGPQILSMSCQDPAHPRLDERPLISGYHDILTDIVDSL